MTLAAADAYLNSTVVFCPKCGHNEIACIIANKNGVFLEKQCPDNSRDLLKIASDYKWYLERTAQPKPFFRAKNTLPSIKGCPFDCGICAWHSGTAHKIILPVTHNNSLKHTKHNFISRKEIQNALVHLKDLSNNHITINLTGNNLSTHPELFEIITMIKQQGITGIELDIERLGALKHWKFLEKIKMADVQLSIGIGTVNSYKDNTFHYADIKPIKDITDNLEQHQIPVNLKLKYYKKTNDKELKDIITHYFKKDFIRNITVQIDATIHDDSEKDGKNSITIDSIEKIISETEFISLQDFSVHPLYHPLCCSAAYYIISDDTLVALSQLFNQTDLSGLFEKCCHSNSKKDFAKNLRDSLNQFWSSHGNPEQMSLLKKFVAKIYSESENRDKDGWTLANKMIKGIIIHRYMDKNCLDIDKVSHCADYIWTNSGKLIPVCAHNILYH